MSIEILWQIFLFGIALSADAFSVAVALGLNVCNLTKKRALFVALVFGVFQGLFPLIGYWILEGIEVLVGAAAGKSSGEIMALVVTIVSFCLLIFIGLKMLIESVRDMKKPPEEKKEKLFSVKEVLIMGVATAIDAFASGIAFHNADASGVSLSNNVTIWLHVSIIICITFLLSFLGVSFGNFFEKLLKGKIEIAGIIGGSILILLAIYILLSHFFIS